MLPTKLNANSIFRYFRWLIANGFHNSTNDECIHLALWVLSFRGKWIIEHYHFKSRTKLLDVCRANLTPLWCAGCPELRLNIISYSFKDLGPQMHASIRVVGPLTTNLNAPIMLHYLQGLYILAIDTYSGRFVFLNTAQLFWPFDHYSVFRSGNRDHHNVAVDSLINNIVTILNCTEANWRVIIILTWHFRNSTSVILMKTAASTPQLDLPHIYRGKQQDRKRRRELNWRQEPKQRHVDDRYQSNDSKRRPVDDRHPPETRDARDSREIGPKELSFHVFGFRVLKTCRLICLICIWTKWVRTVPKVEWYLLWRSKIHSNR